MNISLRRPARRRQPRSSMKPRSPVRSQSRTRACVGGLVVAPVAAHRRGGAEPHLADLAVGQRAGLVVADADLDAAAGPADGEERLLLVGVERGAGAAAAALGGRVADRVGGVEARHRLAHHRRRRRGAAHHDRLHAARGRRRRGPRAGAAPSAAPRRRARGSGARRCTPARRRPASGRGCGWSSRAAGTRAAWW